MNTHTTMPRAVTMAMFAASAALALPTVSSAAPMTFEVDTLSDNSADGVTLRDAINDANANAGPDTITFAPGLSGTLTLTSGVMAISDDLTINGPDSELLTIDADNASGVFLSLAGNIDFALSSMTIVNGAGAADGGAVELVEPTSVDISQVIFMDNVATGHGGAVSIVDASGPIDVHATTFDANTAGFARDGGGLYVVDSGASNHPITINLSTFSDQQADGFGGGAYIQAPSDDITITNSISTQNRTLTGSAAGMHLDGRTVSVFSTLVHGNQAAGQVGGLFANSNGGTTTLDTVTATENTGNSIGGVSANASTSVRIVNSVIDDNVGGATGGISIFAGTDLGFFSSEIRNNTGGQRGGIELNPMTSRLSGLTVSGNTGDAGAGIGSIGGGLTIADSTVSGNMAPTGFGGGLFAVNTAVTIDTSTFSGNEADSGGAISTGGGATLDIGYATIVENSAAVEAGGIHMAGLGIPELDRTILANNTAPLHPDTNAGTVNAAFSLLGDTAGKTINGSGNIEGVDPELGPLADNIGRTLTHLPMPGSPVINAGGDPLFASDEFDQRERLRPNGAVDIGSVEVSDPATSVWVPVTPARIVDTRATGETIDDLEARGGKLIAASQIRFPVAGRAGVPDDARAVVANITAVRPDDTGFITAHPCVDPRPLSASLNYTADVNLGNEVIIGLDAGDLCLFSRSATHITVDVVGYVPADSGYVPNDPVRLLDTRANGVTFDGLQQAQGAPGAGGMVELSIRGGIGKAENAVLYITAIGATQNGFVTVWNCLGDRPLASSLNHVAGVNRGNEIVAGLDNGKVCIFTNQDVHLTVDLVGTFRSTNYAPLDTPKRVLDTRSDGQTVDDLFEGAGPLVAGQTLTLKVAGRAGVPSIADTVTVNITAVRPSDVGFITTYPCGTLPLAASLNYVPNVNGGNEIVASVSDAGTICLFTRVATHLTADVTGWTSR
ncbi:MAG: choice-of-anchor Q domain-containing protein [Ilumatobacter sp.]